jgi:hypothetical protein
VIALITQHPIAYSFKSNSDRPSPPKNLIAYSFKSNSDRPSPPKNLIAYSPHQTATARIDYDRLK